MQNQKYIRKKNKRLTKEQLIAGILSGDFSSLSRAITLCESKKPIDRSLASELIKACLPHSGNSLRIGITGVPGVGKSTFIENFGLHLIEKENKKIAVLAVDPSSEKSGGSILGDKTRMKELSKHPNAYIRPSPSSGALGGVAHHSRESIILCEAAGFNVIIVETVGVGQSETEVRQMTDFFLLLMLAGAGDELQGIKRGIMEMADGIMINKADGENLPRARQASQDYKNALHLFPREKYDWETRVGLCSALNKTNLEEAWKMIKEYKAFTSKNGFFESQRQIQLSSWFKRSVNDFLKMELLESNLMKELLSELESQVVKKTISPYEAAEKVIKEFKSNLRS